MFAGISTFILPQSVFKSFVPQLSADPVLAPAACYSSISYFFTNKTYTYRRPSILENLEPACGAVSRGGVGDFGEVCLDRPEMVTTNGLIGAAAIPRLLDRGNQLSLTDCCSRKIGDVPDASRSSPSGPPQHCTSCQRYQRCHRRCI